MDELERLQAELDAQSERIAELEDDVNLAEQALVHCDEAYREIAQAVEFWRDAAISQRDRADRAEHELAWGRVDAIMYQWNRAAVRFFLPTRCGLDD